MNDAEEVKVLEYFRGTTSGSCASSFGVCCVFEVWPKWFSLLVIVLSRMIGNDHYCTGQQLFFCAGNLWICLPRREQHLLHIKVLRDCHLPQKSWIHILIRNWFWSEIDFDPHSLAGSRLDQAAALRSASAAPMFVSWGSILRLLLSIWWEDDRLWGCDGDDFLWWWWL